MIMRMSIISQCCVILVCSAAVLLQLVSADRHKVRFNQKTMSQNTRVEFLAITEFLLTRSLNPKNLLHLNRLTRTDSLKLSAAKLKSVLPVLEVPENEIYRIGLLNILLETVINKTFTYVNTRQSYTQMINSLCNS